MTSNESPVLRQCKTLTASIKYNRLRIEVFRSAKYFFFIRFFRSCMLNQPTLANCICFMISMFLGRRKAFWKNRFYNSEQFSLFISKWIWFWLQWVGQQIWILHFFRCGWLQTIFVIVLKSNRDLHSFSFNSLLFTLKCGRIFFRLCLFN